MGGGGASGDRRSRAEAAEVRRAEAEVPRSAEAEVPRADGEVPRADGEPSVLAIAIWLFRFTSALRP